MQNDRIGRFIIVISVLFSIIVATFLIQAFWISHDTSNLLLHISISLNIILLTGLFFWFGRRWKYFKIASESGQLIGWGSLTIYNYLQGIRWMNLLLVLICIISFFSFFEEIKKFKSVNKTE